MNILRKGRRYSDQSHPFTGSVDRYAIERVSLLVAKPGTNGRWEAHTHSRRLMQRLDAIGRGKTTLKGLSIAGKGLGALYVGALNLYLKACNGLTSFRRDRVICSTRGDFESLLSKVGINYQTYARRTSIEVPTGPGDLRGA